MRDLTKEEMQAVIEDGEDGWKQSDIVEGAEYLAMMIPSIIFCYRKGEHIKCIDIDRTSRIHGSMEEMVSWFRAL